MRKNTILFNCLFAFLLSFGTMFATNFTVTIDAGHGGKDPGAIGSFAKEKNINLGVALKVGRLIDSRYPDVRVVYTRKTDVFIPLEERAEIANNAHSNLFICIHTNSSPSAVASGAETYTLGLAKTQANMNVARRENAVILLEDNYKQRYQGFNPNSTDSYIMFEYMQDKYIDRSVQFASDVQTQFSQRASRANRGVRQAGFWVLHRTSMPAVLIEVGYISNQQEEEFISSDEGQQRLAEAIVAAFGKFKHEHERRSGKSVAANEKNDAEFTSKSAQQNRPDSTPQVTASRQPESKKAGERDSSESRVSEEQGVGSETKTGARESAENVVFKVQILSSPFKLKATSAKLKGLKDFSFYIDNGTYKYTTAESENYNQVVNAFRRLLKTFPDAFVVAFQGNRKIVLQDGVKQWKQKH